MNVKLRFTKPKICKKYSKNHWSASHLSCPTPIHLKKSKKIRIYYTSKSQNNIGAISYFDVCEDDPTNVLEEANDPIFTSGEKGQFDDNGVFAVSIIIRDNIFELYYIGFELLNEVKYKIFSGCATSSDGINFKRIKQY